MIKILISIFIYILSITGAYSSRYGFDDGLSSWGVWGTGIGHYDIQFGNKKPGSIYLGADFGEEHTLYREFSKLEKGFYTIEFSIKGIDLANNALWSFYNRGKGTETAFESFEGDFSWSKVSFSVDLTESNNLEFWLRLRKPGQVWFDDFSIKKTTKPFTKLKVTNLLDKRLKKPVYSNFPTRHICKKEGAYLKKKYKKCPICGGELLKNKFVSKSDNELTIFKKKLEIKPYEFYELFKNNISTFPWHKYNQVELTIFNPDQTNKEISVVLTDNKTVNYWSRLNFVSSLTQGENTLRFDLKRFVGERGSVRYRREINLKKLQKFFLILDYDKKSKHKKNIILKKITLKNVDYPKSPKGLIAFDFTSHKKRLTNGFKPVTTQHIYHKKRKYGFLNPKFWRVTDSVYTPKIDRDTIGVLEGKFIVDLPNGEYRGQITMDHLGYWDVPFWKNREASVNNTSIVVDKNTDLNSFLDRILKYENFEPKLNSNIYESYLKQLLKPISFDFKVKNREAIFTFKGDPSAIQLNSLFIWPKKIDKKVQGYLKKLNNFKTEEFNTIFRSINLKQEVNKRFGLVESQLDLIPNGNKIIAKSLDVSIAENESSFSILQLPSGDKDITYELDLILDSQFQDKIDINIHPIRYLLASENANHETYKIVGKYLDNPQREVISYQNMVRYLGIKIRLKDQFFTKPISGIIHVKGPKQSFKLPFTVKVLNYELPQVKLPIGFIGLDPFPNTYFDSSKLRTYIQKLRLSTIEKLGGRGFTTFTGLPAYEDNESLTYKHIDEIFNIARNQNFSNTFFTYGGNFLNSFPSLEDENAIASNILKPILKKPTWPKIIHTISDEAAGYSNVIQRDKERLSLLKKRYPFLSLGTFTHDDISIKDFNLSFDYGIYSTLKDPLSLNKSKQKWGMYNISSAYFDNPQVTFSKNIYLLQQLGMQFYLDWHLGAQQNYPYYDLDGRESDIAMMYPRSNGDVLPAVKIELATEGLNLYRKLLLIESSIKQGLGNEKALKKAKNWLEKFKKTKPQYGHQNTIKEFKELKKVVNSLLEEIYP